MKKICQYFANFVILHPNLIGVLFIRGTAVLKLNIKTQMAKNLVIVESPAKAKTISKLLGSDYLVKPSFGHIRDLSKKNYGIDIENHYMPVYEVDAEKSTWYPSFAKR